MSVVVSKFHYLISLPFLVCLFASSFKGCLLSVNILSLVFEVYPVQLIKILFTLYKREVNIDNALTDTRRVIGNA